MYDKKMWDDDGAWIQPPTFRAVADIALDIVGNVTGQKWIGYLDDALFATLDLTGGYKTPAEVGLELGKKALTSAASYGISSLGSAASAAASAAITNTCANVAAQAGISVAQSYATSVATSAINSVNLVNGELKFDGEGFGKSLYSASTIGGALGAGVTAGLNEYSLGARTVDAVDADGNILKDKSGKVMKTTEYTRAQGLNSTQIDNMGKFNSLMGGLSSSAVSFAMDGKATFNILNASDLGIKSNTGLFELTVGKDGISSTIGSGGTNISMGNIMASLNGAKASVKNAHINNTVNKKYEGNMNVANMLRAQYGFGDKVQLDQLDSILKGNTELRFGNTTDGKAQTVDENGKRIVHMNMDKNGDWKMGAIMLGHESYRDGVVGSADEQLSETRAAVAGHTDMTLRMMGDNLYAASMAQLVGSNQNLQIDLLARALGDDIFNSYVDGTYDSSADYWKLTFDGQLISDGSGWLKDEDGMYVNIDGTRSKKPIAGKTLGAEKQESGLLNILNGTSGKGYNTFSDRKKIQAQQLMQAAGLSMDSTGQWNNLKDKKLDMNMVMEYSGNSVASEVFARYYDSTVDSYIASTLGLDIGDVEGRYVPHNSAMEDRMMRLTNAKMSFYKSAGAFVDEKYTMISQGYNQFSEKNYSNYKGFHYGIDIVSITGEEGASILAGLSGIVTQNLKDSGKKEGGGNAIHMQYGYNFENSFIRTGIYGEYDHFQKQSKYQIGDFVNSNTQIGIMGDTGNSTGPHLHYSVYTTGTNNYSKTSMKILFGSNYNSSVMHSGTYDKNGKLEYWNNKYVYNPEPFYFRTKK